MSTEDQLKLRAAFIADAMSLLGTGAFADGMKVTARTAQHWTTASARRPVSDDSLRGTMELLVAHRQRTSNLIRTIRQHLEPANGED